MILLHIIGAVCLLLWGTRMVKLGFTRAFGSRMRQILAQGTRNRWIACASGMGVAALLQSSTAATLLLISLIKRNPVALPAAMAVVIGADISTTLIAQVLSFDLSWLSPALLMVGVLGYMKYEHTGRKSHLFRVCIGLGLMLLSLSLIRNASAPLTHSETLPLILAPLRFDPLLAVIFSALLTWAMHSSLAAVLLFAALASNGIIDLPLGLLLVLGANIGSSIIAFASTYREGIGARRITGGILLMRLITAILAYIFLDTFELLLLSSPAGIERHIVNFHSIFAVLMAVIFLPCIEWTEPLLRRIFPDAENVPKAPHEPVYLDENALSTPVVALAGAARETLRMADMVAEMLEKTIATFESNNPALADAISRKDNTVDRLYGSIKLYLTRLTQQALDPKEADRYLQIMTFATNLEHIGDIIDKSLIEMARKKIKHRERFSEAGWAEIKDFHTRVLTNMRMAHSIFLSEDPVLARKLVEGKRNIREAERDTATQHFRRLRDGLPESIATSSLHLDIIRDYRRINSYITAVAYSIIENAKKYEHMRKAILSDSPPQTQDI